MKEKINHDVLVYHCIVHQEALCAQTFPREMNHVMELVIKIVNTIIAHALHHRQFKELLLEVNSEYGALLIHNEVRWLSRGNVLKRFSALFCEIELFLNEIDVSYPELCDPFWLQKFYFMQDVTGHLNNLNKKLQGKGNVAFSLFEEIISFENKLDLLIQNLEQRSLHHFVSLKKYQDDKKCDLDVAYFKTVLLGMKKGFAERFQEFRKTKATLAFVKCPLKAITTEINFSPFNIDIANFESQLVELKSKELWSSKFERLLSDLETLERNKCELAMQHEWKALRDLEAEDNLIFKAWNEIPNSFDQLKTLAFSILSMFGSTYSCEQSFSSMIYIKSSRRARITDDNLELCLKLKTTNYKADFPTLVKNMQGHCSH